jgi:hypothetical protein
MGKASLKDWDEMQRRWKSAREGFVGWNHTILQSCELNVLE